LDFEPTTVLSQEQIEFLEEMYEVFGQFSAWKLRHKTQDEPPWANNEINSCEISLFGNGKLF